MTFSLVARDAASGELGVVVASKFLAIGSLVAWAEPGVGAVATQAIMNPTYGRDGLRMLRAGASAHEALDRLTAADPAAHDRQAGIVDAQGRAATFTGAACMDHASGLTGDGWAAQGNLLVSADTVAAVAESFTASAGGGEPLADRLLAALAAGQAAGGDRRGQQAAAILVVGEGRGYGGDGVVVDLRVDDHTAPIDELQRLYALHQLYFGQTPREQWLALGGQLAAEVRERLGRCAVDASGDLGDALMAWATIENLEERVDGGAAIDPIVLEQLRRASPSPS